MFDPGERENRARSSQRPTGRVRETLPTAWAVSAGGEDFDFSFDTP